MFGKYQKNIAGILTAIAIIGFLLTCMSLFITKHQATDSSANAICNGPDVANYTCPGTATQITYRGFPFHFATRTSTIKVGGVTGPVFQGVNAPVPDVVTTLSVLNFIADSLLYIVIVFGIFWLVVQAKSRPRT